MEDSLRPGKPPGIFIDTVIARNASTYDGLRVPSPTSPSLPSFKVSSTPNEITLPPLSPGFPRKASTRSKESRKLLAHLLRQLSSRPMPPTVYETFGATTGMSEEKGFATFVGNMKQAVKLNNNNKPNASRDIDEDDEGESDGTFSTDVTFDLMSQLRDVLMISVLQGWQIFDEPSEDNLRPERNSGKSSSPFRRSINTLHPSGKRSRSPSPAFGGRVQSTELLSQCMSVLTSVVSEDCRFKISPPRPSRPPNALQALTLKVAQFLLHTHRNSPKIVSQIAYAILPAFFTFPQEMYARLLAFYEESIIRGVLDSLRDAQGTLNSISEMSPNPFDFQHGGEEPMVSIRVDGVDDEEPAPTHKPQWTPWVDSLSHQVINILSTNAPLQGSAIYFLASIVPPLLAAILDNIDFGMESKSGLDVLHRLHRLLDLIFTAKLDAYLDVLEVLAYHTPRARHSAASLLVAFWPKAVGHLTITRALKSSAYLDNSPAMQYVVQDHPHEHQFVPWRFTSTRRTPRHECRSCSQTLDGFGLCCPFCSCSVHFDCFDVPSGCHLAKYSMTSDASMQKVAIYRFSDVLGGRRDYGPQVLRSQDHTFRPVNIFALCLCTACREPLWGIYAQGYRCISCMQFVHWHCATSRDVHPCQTFEPDSSHILVQRSTLRQSCVAFYGDLLQLTKEDLTAKSFEEVSVLQSVVWVQVQLLENGLALGSMELMKKGSKKGVDAFELHHTLKMCEELIESDSLPISDAQDEYLQTARITRKKHTIVFDWANLVYIASTIKAPFTMSTGHRNSSDMLGVYPPDVSDPSDSFSHPYELVSTSHLRNALGCEFNLRLDSITKLMLNHLLHLGLFQRVDGRVDVTDVEAGKGVACLFPLPFGLDFSTDVETLFGSIEACLTHIDLSINETGFLLLARRLPPNSMASDYATRRLVRVIVSWVFAEDEDLATILREYVAKQRVLPGVQSSRDVSWPQTQRSRALPQGSSNNGGDYVATRRSLLAHYAVPWLQALHNEEPETYTDMLFDICLDTSQESLTTYDVLHPKPRASVNPDVDSGKHLDKLLRLIIRLSQNSITFAILDDLFNRWLDVVANLPSFKDPVPSLLRLLPRENTDSYRMSTFDSGQHGAIGIGSGADMAGIDPWRRVITATTESKESLLQALHWLYVFARSGAEIPTQTWNRFITAMGKFKTSVSESSIFVKAMMSSIWLRPTARLAVQDMFASLHERHLAEVLEEMRTGKCSPDVLVFVRLSLGTCLTLYGCERSKLLSLKMILDEEVEGLPSRRKLGARQSLVSDPIIIPPSLMSVLSSYLEANNDDVSCLIAQFVNMFITDSPYLEPHEIDNFILRNGVLLSKCAWQLYGIQRDVVSELRASFLLRVIVVDDQPFHSILKRWFRKGGEWLSRLEGVARLFRIILDVSSPSFNVEDRLWRSHVIDVFEYFFVSLWADEREEVRLTTETLAATLLSVHFDAISSCWNEVLSKSPIQEKVHLVSFLIQLRSHFPLWRVVSWEVIIETLLEDQYDEKEEQDGPASAYLSMYGLSTDDEKVADKKHSDSSSSLLRVSLILLSLNMISSGIEINYNHIMRLKHQLVRMLGFDKVDLRPNHNGLTFDVIFGEVKEVPKTALPCLHELVVVLDAPYAIDPYAYTGVREDTNTPLLIGAPFVEVALGLFGSIENISALPILTLKNMLEMLGIIVQKHDIERKTHLKHLSNALREAMSRSLDLLDLDINYECRQLALYVVQSFIKTWTGPGLRAFVHLSIERVAKLIASQSHTSQDILVAQGKAFIESTLSIHSNNGTMVGLFRRPLDKEVFMVLKQIIDSHAKAASSPSDSLRERLLRDTLPRAAETDQTVFQTVLNNLQTYVEVIYHQGYTADCMMFVGQQLTQLARRSVEFPAHCHINPSPLLVIATLLIQHNKALSRDLLTYTDAVLRIILTRLDVETSNLAKLIQVTATLYRRTHSSDSNAPTNTILAVIFELLGDALRMKARMMPSTIKSMLEALMTTEIAGHSTPIVLYQQEYPTFGDNGFQFLLHHIWGDVTSDSDFAVSLAVGKLVLQAASQDPSVMSRIAEHTVERASRQSMVVRAWNVILIAALMDPTESRIQLIYRQLPTFSLAHTGALRGYFQAGTSPPDSAIADINHAYISIKLWLLLAQRYTTRGEENSVPALSVWNELWPPFECLVNMFEAEVRAGLSVTLAILTWSTVADLFIFIRSLHSPIAMQSMSHIAILNRLIALGRGESHTAKLSRALRSLSEPVLEVPVESLVNQVTKDLIAAEKLRILEAKRDIGRVLPERRAGRLAS